MPDGFTIPLRVTPRAGKNAIELFQSGDVVLKIKTTALPEDGKANSAVQKILSDAMAIRKTAIVLIQGEISRNKVFKVQTENPQSVLNILVTSLSKTGEQGRIFQVIS